MAAAPTDDNGVDLPLIALSDAHIANLIPTLPLETRCPPFPLRQLGGFWLPEFVLPAVAAVHTHFQPRADDVVLASFPKSGTTWLKALAFAVMTRDQHPPTDLVHPLRHRNPHECVRFFESAFALPDDEGGDNLDVFASFPSPRLLATHLPYNLLPERIVKSCRVVYVCRDPKDALVSAWLFTVANAAKNEPAYTVGEAFELFCEGRCVGGPQWGHVLGYWEASRRWPDKVLFLRYEEMLRDPSSNVRRLAEFLGCPFSGDEEAAGTVEAVVELCSLGSLKRAKKTGSRVTELAIEHGTFFRKGTAGDWRNHLTPEMAARLDGVVEQAVQGSGFAFSVDSEDSL